MSSAVKKILSIGGKRDDESAEEEMVVFHSSTAFVVQDGCSSGDGSSTECKKSDVKASADSVSPIIEKAFHLCCEICGASDACCGVGCCINRCCLGKLAISLASTAIGQPFSSLLNKAAERWKMNQEKVSTLDSVEDTVCIPIPEHNATRVSRFAVKGLTCADCSLVVENKLTKYDGVLKAQVSCITHEAMVVYDGQKISSPSILTDVINSTGFTARLLRDESAEKKTDSAASLDKLRVTLLVCNRSSSMNGVPFNSSTLGAIFSAVEGVEEVGEMKEQAMKNDNEEQVKGVEVEVVYDGGKIGPRTLLAVMSRANLHVRIPSMSEVGAAHDLSGSAMIHMWRYRMLLGVLLTIPMIILSFLIPSGAFGKNVEDALDTEIIAGREGLPVRALLAFLLTTPIQIYTASPLYSSAFRAARFSKTANIDTLVVLSSSIAYVYSIAIIIAKLAGATIPDRDFFETPALLITLIAVGRWLEAISKGKASDSVRQLVLMQASNATWLPFWQHAPTSSDSCSDGSVSGKSSDGCCNNGTCEEEKTSDCESDFPVEAAVVGIDSRVIRDPRFEFEMSVNFLHRGDCIKVAPGGKVATDGVVIDGSSAVDESTLTGESTAVAKKVGDVVYGGTINGHGVLYVRVTKVASENVLSSIAAMVRQAQSSKPDIQRFADVVSAWFVPIVLLLSVVVFFIWLGIALGEGIDMPSDVSVGTFALQFALSLLVVSCPCAVGLAVPTAIMVATGVAARYGILFKGGPQLEMTHRINAIVFDKTGTLTTGKPTVTQAILFNVTVATKSSSSSSSSSYESASLKTEKKKQEENRPTVKQAKCDSSSSFPCCSSSPVMPTKEAEAKKACADSCCSEHPEASKKSRCKLSADEYDDADECCKQIESGKEADVRDGVAVGKSCFSSGLTAAEGSCCKGCEEEPADDGCASSPCCTSGSAVLSSNDFWMLVGAAEQGSEHPLASAIVSHARQQIEKKAGQKKAVFPSGSDFTAIPGMGITCTVAGHAVVIGSLAFVESKSASSSSCCSVPQSSFAAVLQSALRTTIADMESAGHTVVYVAIDSQMAAVIGISDALRRESASVIQSLTSMGVEVWLMSGDQTRTTAAVARSLGVNEGRVFGSVLPADKATKVKELQQQGKIVAMVGDGINDSPALAQAHVGIGLASGTDIAMESAHVVLVKSHLQDVITAIHLSRATFARIRLNFLWALLYNVAGILLASGAFYSLGRVAIPPAFAGLSELLSSLPVVMFSLLLNSYRSPACSVD